MTILRSRIVAALALGAAAASAQVPSNKPSTARLAYPDTRESAQVDTLHGQAVADPYRWLEDVDSPETKAWVEAQNKVTFGYLETLPERKMIRERLTQLWNYPRVGVPSKDGNYTFWTENSGLQNQSVLYVREGRSGQARVLIDPNTLSTDGTAALAGGGRSRDGRLYAYSVAQKGSDWTTMYVKDVATGRDLSDTLQWLRGSGASWTNDAKGFFYVRYPQQEGNRHVTVTRNPAVYYHRLGTPQSGDVLVYERPDQPEWYLGAGVTEDGRYLLVNASKGTESKNRIWYADLGDPKAPNVRAPIQAMFVEGDASYNLVDNDGSTFYMVTDRDAPRSKLVAFDVARPDAWRTVVPESKDNLTGADVAGGKLVLFYLADAKSDVRFVTKDGREAGSLPLPGIGSVGGFSAKEDESEVYYSFSSFVYPSTTFRYDLKAGTNEVFKAPAVKFDVSKYETKQVFYTSRDGTRVPMFITMRKGTKLDGNNPTLLYAYGGFDIATLPGFSPANLVWLELGGVYAVANIRGGGEYGKAWHEAGMFEKKQNVFDDFIGAAEYLVREKVTSPAHLAISGRSNGGLLIGAAITQRPELFR
ncbi:MAG: prolyl oligopeptidase family serine peptidase, partial [Gemmatimonadaceae bacterium]